MPAPATRRHRPAPSVERLEGRDLLSVTAALVGGVLAVNGDAGNDNISVTLDRPANQLVVRSYAIEVARFASPAVTSIVIDAGAGNDIVRVGPDVIQPTVIDGGAGNDVLFAGGGQTTLNGGPGRDKLVAGPGLTVLNGDGGANVLERVKPTDPAIAGPNDRVLLALPVPPVAMPVVQTLTTAEVDQLIRRASGATLSEDAIIAVVDRGGNLLGLRVEGGVNPAVAGSIDTLVFAIDGAISKARTAAFFANNQAPLTSRTVQFISQSTITQREVESYPSITDPNSPWRGPGFVAPVGIKGHFPPNVPFTPQVDLFLIEHTNRDSLVAPGPDNIKGTADDITLPSRFNVPTEFIPPGQEINPPESFGLISGMRPNAQSRGIATLPGGIPIYKEGQLVGGIGVFFPGATGFATEENSSLSATHDPSKPDRSLEAEYMAFAAVNGAPKLGLPIGDVAGVAPVAGIELPLTPENQRIDLVGITLDIVGPNGVKGPEQLFRYGRALPEGNPDSGTNQGFTTQAGLPVPEGWLVVPHDGDGITAAEVERLITQGIQQATRTRAAIRLPLNSETKMVFAVADRSGNIVGLYRMPDATVFSLDVAVAKARNVAYYANPTLLQPADRLPEVPPGTALTNRSFRYLALPRYPEGIDGRPPGPFSILTDPGTDPNTGLMTARLPASVHQSVQGFDAFNPGTNFRSTTNPANRNGIVFFPGSAPLYRDSTLLIGGFGVSGDGVDQDDVVTFMGAKGFEPSPTLRVDNVFVRGVRVPYQKFNRNPEGGIT